MTQHPKRGEIYWISLDPTIGSEVKKTRPGLILSNDLSNKHSQRIIVGPITSSVNKIYPFEAEIALPKEKSKVMIDQIRAVDKRRLGKKIGKISALEMRDVERAIKLTLALG